MFLTCQKSEIVTNARRRGRNPLKSGQCFLRDEMKMQALRFLHLYLSQSPQIGSMFLTLAIRYNIKADKEIEGRNPLESGQCFSPRGNSRGNVARIRN